MGNIIKIAAGELGIKEISGINHNPRIIEYQKTTGLEFGNDEVAWCSIFVNWCALQAGLPMSNKANARSWLKMGRKTSFPKPGDIVVFWRSSPSSWKGHVGFFMGFSNDGSEVFCLGGNQDNEVNISSYNKDRIIEFRRLKLDTTLTIPLGYLRKGDSNSNVKKLQLILIELDLLNDTADGVFGNKTETALKEFQKNNNITIDGIYGSESRNSLNILLD